MGGGGWSRDENKDRWNNFVSGSHHWRKLELAEYRWGVKHKLTGSRNCGAGLWISFPDRLRCHLPVSLYSVQNVYYMSHDHHVWHATDRTFQGWSGFWTTTDAWTCQWRARSAIWFWSPTVPLWCGRMRSPNCSTSFSKKAKYSTRPTTKQVHHSVMTRGGHLGRGTGQRWARGDGGDISFQGSRSPGMPKVGGWEISGTFPPRSGGFFFGDFFCSPDRPAGRYPLPRSSAAGWWGYPPARKFLIINPPTPRGQILPTSGTGFPTPYQRWAPEGTECTSQRVGKNRCC